MLPRPEARHQKVFVPFLLRLFVHNPVVMGVSLVELRIAVLFIMSVALLFLYGVAGSAHSQYC